MRPDGQLATSTIVAPRDRQAGVQPRGGAAHREATSVVIAETIRRHQASGLEEGALHRIAVDVVDRIWGDGVRVTSFVPLVARKEVDTAVGASSPVVPR